MNQHFGYMPNGMPMQNMAAPPHQMHPSDMINEIDSKITRLERQVKRLEHRLMNLEQEKIMPLSSKTKGFQTHDSGMYMM